MPRQKNRISDLRQQLKSSSFFQGFSQIVSSTLDLQEISQTTVIGIKSFLRSDTCALLLLDQETGELNCTAATGLETEALEGARVKLDETASGFAVRRGTPILIRDIQTARAPAARKIAKAYPGAQSAICIPINSRKTVIGAIELVNSKSKRSFSRKDLALLKKFANCAGIAIENARYVQHIREMTIIDECTGLYNARHLRQVLDAELYRSARYGYEFSVIFMDLDRFKRVNDLHGHLIGSRLLGLLGSFIKSHLRLIDSAFRYGGDEFVILLPQTSRKSGLVAARRLRDLLHSRVFQPDEGLNLRIRASFGIAAFPSDANTLEDLLRVADETMYAAKTSTRRKVLE